MADAIALEKQKYMWNLNPPQRFLVALANSVWNPLTATVRN
jgi:hypothetical protein